MKESIGAKPMVVPTPVWCVGSFDKNEKPNIMTIAWGGICCSNPPCVTISLRKSTYSYKNIMEKMAYTINVPSEDFVKEADYFGISSGKNVDKFLESGLTPIKAEFVDAPYVKEFPMILECKVVHHYEIGLHTHFVGEIKDIKVDIGLMEGEKSEFIERIKPLLFTPEIKTYHGVGKYLGEAFSIGKDSGALK